VLQEREMTTRDLIPKESRAIPPKKLSRHLSLIRSGWIIHPTELCHPSDRVAYCDFGGVSNYSAMKETKDAPGRNVLEHHHARRQVSNRLAALRLEVHSFQESVLITRMAALQTIGRTLSLLGRIRRLGRGPGDYSD
jgi:hypothetical protein